MNDAVDLDLRAPEAMSDVSAGRKRRQVQPFPAMHTGPTQESKDAAGFVLAVRPKPGEARRQFRPGCCILRAIHPQEIAVA